MASSPLQARGHKVRLFRRLALNRIDLIAGLAAIIIMTAAGILIWRIPGILGAKNGASHSDITGALFSSWVLILLALIGGAIKITSTRQSLIRLFVSEIKALQFGLSNMEMLNFWRQLFEKPEAGAMGFADAPREENYFQFFDSLGDNIGNLHPNVVEAIVRFYTYLKMSRDAASALRSWKQTTEPAVRRVHVSYVVRLLTQSMMWGFVALWFMGYKAGRQERDFLENIQTSFEAVFGAGSFESFRDRHVHRIALERFFSPEPQSSA